MFQQGERFRWGLAIANCLFKCFERSSCKNQRFKSSFWYRWSGGNLFEGSWNFFSSFRYECMILWWLFMNWWDHQLSGTRFLKKGNFKLQGRRGRLNYLISFVILQPLLCRRPSILKLNALTRLVWLSDSCVKFILLLIQITARRNR